MKNTTEEAIRRAAVELIAQRGYEAMSLRGLAARAGVNTSTLYLYFEGKQQLLGSLIVEYYEGLFDTWLQSKPTVVPAKIMWLAFVRCHVTYHLRNLQHGPLGCLELGRLDEMEQEAAELARGRYLNEIESIISLGITEKAFECPAPKLYSRILLNLLTQNGGWHQESNELSQEQIIWHYIRITSKVLALDEAGKQRA